ncbi:MAG TPA: isoprenylcysteine carboxylmethyltransferase family protein [Candidatus Sulfotelmatobacter sp.]|nr:isoprenylcysteine carboxylmethyltransferase family protein [Candidatus Sulfotelmatobacter sp.]
MIGRISTLLYGIFCYLVFLASFLYAIAFLGDFGVPRTIDSGLQGSIGRALAINAGLLALFALQHSIMARSWFKRAWTRIVPPAAERSTYVLLSSLALILLFWQWRPIGGSVWQVDNEFGTMAIYWVYAAGWMLLLLATFLINHFDLFGLRQVYLRFRGQEYTGLPFRTPGLYRMVRHPIYLSWLCIFWATPRMTIAHLVFALGTTGYMLIAIQLEERDLIRAYGDAYRRYKRQVPSLLPVHFGRKTTENKLPELNPGAVSPTVEYPGN